MQRYTQQTLVVLGTILLSACTKEIDLKLEDRSNKVVIEATVNEGAGPHTVLLSRSVRFDTPNDFPAISNATVLLSDDQGNSEQLVETSPGRYTASTLAGVQGRTYQLSVGVDGSTFTATCHMPVAVALDTVRMDSLLVFGSYEKIVFAGLYDPQGTGNNYHFLMRVNGELQPGVLVQNDLVEDGNYMEQPLNFMDDEKIESGDTVEVTLQCITPEIFTYFFSLSQNIGGETAAPADPPSNFSGGALGYFSAHTASTKSAIAP